MASFRKPVIWVAGVAALGGLVWFLFLREDEPESALAKYETTKVDRGQIVAKVTATGTLSALVTVQVGSQVSGRVQALFVDFNDPVTKGQVIAKVDPRMFESQIRTNTKEALA